MINYISIGFAVAFTVIVAAIIYVSKVFNDYDNVN